MSHTRNTLASAAQPLPKGAPTEAWLDGAAHARAKGYVIAVTPAMATEWLKQNTSNRRYRPAHMHTISTEMTKGEWRLTHQGIAFGTTGRLLDGQHRLQAIIDSNTTQLMLVFVDAIEDTFANYDRGAKRDIGDVLLIDPKIAAIGQTIVRTCVRRQDTFEGRRAMPAEVARVLETFGPDIEALHAASAGMRTGRTLCAVRAAWVVHHHLADAADQKRMAAQWRAFVDLDVKRMDESTASGERRLAVLGNTRGGSKEVEAMCIGWLMFDPARRDLQRILIKNTSTALDEFREAVRSVVPGLSVAAEEPKRRVVQHGYNVMADPVRGPEIRAMAQAAIAARAAARVE